MQPFSLIAVGIGAVLALFPIETVAAHPAPTLRSPNRPPEKRSPVNAVEAQQQANAAPEAPAAFAPSASPTAKPSPPAAIVQSPPASDPSPPAAPDPASSPAPADSSPAAPNTAPSTAPTAPITLPPQSPSDQPIPAPATAAPTEAAPAPTSPINPASAATDPAPTYLDPSPNPLQTPTQPSEVQIVGTQPLTLRQALELAQRNSQALQTAQQQLNRTRAALRQAEAANLPTARVSAGFQAQGNDQGQTQINPLTGAPTSQGGFNVNPVLNGTAQLSYDIFTSGQRSATIGAAQQQVRFQELQLETTAEDLRLNVTIDYYAVQDADEQVRIAQSALEQSLRSLQDTQAQERAGIGTRFDVLQSQVQVANDQQQLTQQLSQQRVARRQLIQRLNLSEVVDISAAEPVAVADLWNLSLEDSIVLAYRNRAELEQQLVQRQIGDFQRRASLAQLGPQVAATATYSVQNNLDSDQGFVNSVALGAQVDLLLFDGGASRAAAQQQEANIVAAESQFADSRSQVRFQVEQAFYNLRANFDNIQTAALAQEQAAESLRLARLRFQAGVGIQSDVLRAQTELTRAEVNRVGAILGYNRSLAQLQRAVSNFPDGNLADAP